MRLLQAQAFTSNHYHFLVTVGSAVPSVATGALNIFQGLFYSTNEMLGTSLIGRQEADFKRDGIFKLLQS